MTLISPRATRTTPLASTTLDVTIVDLMAEHTLCHRFENTGTTAIEAVFTFPVPLDAAFLGMQATLAGETVHAQIHPRRLANRTYDAAIAQGHSAVLLSAPEAGVLTVSLGNLKPGETGLIELRFATVLKVSDRSARFVLPFVHRPRYGRWSLESLETPTHDLLIEHPLSATFRVRGLLGAAAVTCATHAVRFARVGDGMQMSLSQALLDRDLVLLFELDQQLAPCGHRIVDGDATLGLASFVVPPSAHARQPLDLVLVLDGSGSMNGDAIAQSQAALLAVVQALDSEDRIQVLRFGSNTVPMLRRLMPATERVRQSLRAMVATVHADLGGTEMGAALQAAIAQLDEGQSERARAIILVTDGAVQPHDLTQAQAAAQSAGVRVLVVAVGSSAGADVLAPFAEGTGGVLERAVPAEPIDAGVMRQFRRARQSAPVALQATWPGASAQPIPMGVFYAGDAVSVAAVLPADAAGEVAIAVADSAACLRIMLGERTQAPALRALLGQRRYQLAAASEREALALHYGLLTADTSAVLVKYRADADRADGLPEIVQVPQMLPDGMLAAAPMFSRAASVMACAPAVGGSASVGDTHEDGMAYLAHPAFLRRQAAEDDEDNAPLVAVNTTQGSRNARTVGRDTAASPAPPSPSDAHRQRTRSRLPAHDLLHALHAVLVDAVLVRQIALPTIDAAIDALPEPLREPLRDLLSSCGLSTIRADAKACARLLDVLHEALAYPAWSAADSAILDQRSGGLRGRIGFHFERGRLLAAIEATLHGG